MALSNLERILSFYPTFVCVLGQINHRDIQVLCMTSKSICRLLKPFLEKKQSVNPKLGKFVADPAELRAKLRETGAVIAGEFARHYFIGVEPVEFDLVLPDPRLDKGRNYNVLTSYLKWCEGYKHLPFRRRNKGLQVWLYTWKVLFKLNNYRLRRFNVLMERRYRYVSTMYR